MNSYLYFSIVDRIVESKRRCNVQVSTFFFFFDLVSTNAVPYSLLSQFLWWQYIECQSPQMYTLAMDS